ncbi:MAG TPA: outer membrane protein assembly factor BamD [Bryobacteraceae bacterium]|nr:outer membrane protein assembly factor BamD [Bryobacteraceae bacterium]
MRVCVNRALPRALAAVGVFALLASCGLKRHPYDNPITKDTQQPDKVLFDRAVNDIEHGRYEVARITLNTLINTYDQSEYMAKAKLAIADSWFREGGAHGLAEAEAEYKDFILFYPTMPEAAEAQNRICTIHYKQMDKPDRDQTQAVRAEDECRQVLVQFPNSKYAPEAEQRLRNIQEAIAEGEFRVGDFYHDKGSNPAAANRLSRLVDQYPLYSKADEALWELGDSYTRMGTRFRPQAGQAYSRIVRDYPLSPLVDQAKHRLKDMEMPIPAADPVAYARMKYELEHRTREGMISRAWGLFKSGPDVSSAAKSGTPSMTTLKPSVPLSVPTVAERAAFVGDVSAQQITGQSDLDTKPDARASRQPQAQQQTAPAATTTTASANATDANGNTLRDMRSIPSNHALTAKEQKKAAKLREKQAKKAAQQAAKLNKSKKSGSEAAPAPVTPNTPPQTTSSYTPNAQQ